MTGDPKDDVHTCAPPSPIADCTVRVMRTLVAILCVVAPGAAIADSTSPSSAEPIESRPSHAGLYVALSSTAVGLVGTMVSYNKVRELEFEKDELITEFQGAYGVQLDLADACADADERDEPLAREISSTCARGRRWATATNIFWYATQVSAAASLYLGYRALKARRRHHQTVTVTPRASADGVAIDLGIRF